VLIVLPLLAFMAFWLCAFLRTGRSHRDWRHTFLIAALVWGVVTTAIMEGLSLASVLTEPAVATVWILAIGLVVAATPWRFQPHRLGIVAIPTRWRSGQPAITFPAVSLARLREHSVGLGGIAVVLLIAGFLAVTGGISTNDALDYHLPRVMHWIQNGSVDFYPTAVSRQLNLNPWAEYAITQFMILGGGDAWANLIQWFAFAGAAVGVSLVARELGASPRGQVFAAVFAATIPMAVLQGSTAQNDLAGAFWVVVLVYWILRLRNSTPESRMAIVRPASVGLAIGAALGLAILTKTTGYVFAIPFLLWLVPIALRRFRWRVVPFGLVAGGLALALNLGHYVRNNQLYGSPLGPGQESPPGQDWGKYTNDVFSLSTLFSNTVRYLALNIGLPNRAAGQTTAVTDFLARFGIDASDPATTWTGTLFTIAAPHTNEDGAGNLLHLALIAVLLIAILVVPALRRLPVVLYSAGTVLGFLIFALLLKWSPWSTRLYLTSFVLFAPVAGLAFGLFRRQWLPRLATVVLLVGAIPFLLYAQHRPVVGNDFYHPTQRVGALAGESPEDQLFVTRPQLQADFEGATAFVATTRCAAIGLWRFDAAEYPVWALLDDALTYQPDIEHIGVINDTRTLAHQRPGEDFAPCVVLSFREFAGDHATATIDGRDYVRVWDSGTVSVYQPAWFFPE